MKLKMCSHCKIEKLLCEFNKNKCRKDGLDNNCKECTKIHAKEFYENNKEKVKNYRDAHKKEHNEYCKNYYHLNKERLQIQNRIYFEQHREENKKNCKEYYSNHKEEARQYKNMNKERENLRRKNAYNTGQSKEHIRGEKLKQAYNITLEEYNQLLQQQNGVCVICGQFEKSKFQGNIKNLSVDHNHKTGEIRGLLCCSCNNGLGRFKDNIQYLENAIKYLQKFNKG